MHMKNNSIGKTPETRAYLFQLACSDLNIPLPQVFGHIISRPIKNTFKMVRISSRNNTLNKGSYKICKAASIKSFEKLPNINHNFIDAIQNLNHKSIALRKQTHWMAKNGLDYAIKETNSMKNNSRVEACLKLHKTATGIRKIELPYKEEEKKHEFSGLSIIIVPCEDVSYQETPTKKESPLSEQSETQDQSPNILHVPPLPMITLVHTDYSPKTKINRSRSIPHKK